MLIESAVACVGGALAYMYLDGKDKRKIQRDWKETLLNCHAEGVRINVKVGDKTITKTFILNKLYNKDYGWFGICNIPTGLKFSALENAKEALENKFSCLIIMEKEREKDYITVKFIKNIKRDYYKPVKTPSPHIIYYGDKMDMSPCFLDISQDPHLLIGGETRTGKTFLLATILTNIIYHYSNNYTIYLSQIMKGEIGLFKKCKPVQEVGYNLEEVAGMLEKGAKITDERSKKFTDLGLKNLNHYNQYYPKNKMKRIIFVIEEISFFVPDDSEDDKIKQLKARCWKAILTIVKCGGSSGCHIWSVVQRSTADNLNTTVRSQLTRISFKQSSKDDSRNIIGIGDAFNLNKSNREFIARTSEGFVFATAPKVDEDFNILNEYVPEILTPKAANPKINEKSDTIINQNIKYSPVVSKTITPEEYFLKTGYVSNSLQEKLSINETTVKPIKNSNDKDLAKQTETAENESVMITSSKDKKKNRTKKKDNTTNNEVNSDVKTK